MNGKSLLVGGVAVLLGLSVWGGASFVDPGPLYAVPGIPCAVNYTRLFDSYTPQNYLFDAVPSLGDAPVDRKPYPEIEAEKHLGRCYADCWEYVAATNEAGKRFVLTLNAWNDEAGLAASVTTTVEVVRAPTDEEKGREITLALLAASDTNCRYQDQVMRRMREAGFAKYRPVGSYTSIGDEGGAKHDGYGGWSWGDFLDRYTVAEDELDKLQNEAERQQMEALGVVKIGSHNAWRRRSLRSPIVKLVDGKKVVDFQPWFDRINGGKAPTYVVILLGGNGVWAQRPENYQYAHAVDAELEKAKVLLAKLRAAAPETVVAVCTSMGGSLDQDSWGHNSYCWNSAVLANKSFLDYNRRMKAYIDSLGDDRLVFVPITQNVDHLKAYPLGRKSGNAMHATFRGGEQLGDALFAWLLHDIETRK